MGDRAGEKSREKVKDIEGELERLIVSLRYTSAVRHIPLPTGSKVLAHSAIVANCVTLLFKQSGLLHGISTSTSSFPLAAVSVSPFLSTETAAL